MAQFPAFVSVHPQCNAYAPANRHGDGGSCVHCVNMRNQTATLLCVVRRQDPTYNSLQISLLLKHIHFTLHQWHHVNFDLMKFALEQQRQHFKIGKAKHTELQATPMHLLVQECVRHCFLKAVLCWNYQKEGYL